MSRHRLAYQRDRSFHRSRPSGSGGLRVHRPQDYDEPDVAACAPEQILLVGEHPTPLDEWDEAAWCRRCWGTSDAEFTVRTAIATHNLGYTDRGLAGRTYRIWTSEDASRTLTTHERAALLAMLDHREVKHRHGWQYHKGLVLAEGDTFL